MRRVVFIAVSACLIASLAGCGPTSGRVSGTVTIDGKPLDYGMVDFRGTSGVASAPVIDGAYAAEQVPVGAVGIAVRSMPRPAIAPPSSLGTTAHHGSLPDRYLDPATSGLSVEVRGGQQRHDLSLTER